MGTSAVLAAMIAVGSLGATISQQDIEQQNLAFQYFWGTDFSWKFEELPVKGGARRARMPYSGYIYPDTMGGTGATLHKYDRAFNEDRNLAAKFEAWDTTAFKEPIERRGPLGLMVWGKRMGTPDWYGHCNGWTAASIRHAEPERSVRRNGVVFTPTDIKALLAELYIYNDTIDLSGTGERINAAVFHAVIANWLGRGGQPLGMDADPGEEKWNYPAYTYNSSSAKRSEHEVEVKLNLAYAKDSSEEYTESPHIRRIKYFHYLLTLNASGEITSGSYYRDSSRIEMLWLPLQPRQGGSEWNDRGNPHIDPQEILSIWRESVPEETRRNWLIVDPPIEKEITVATDVDTLIPLGYKVLTASRPGDTADVELGLNQPPKTVPPAVNEPSPAPQEQAVSVYDRSATDSQAAPLMQQAAPSAVDDGLEVAPAESYWAPVHW